MTEHWFLSSNRMTVGVSVTDGLISDAAPIVRKFIGQPLDNLRAWMRKQGGYSEWKEPLNDKRLVN